MENTKAEGAEGAETAKYVKALRKQLADVTAKYEDAKLEAAQAKDESKALAKQVRSLEAKVSSSRGMDADTRRAVQAMNDRVTALAQSFDTQVASLRAVIRDMRAMRVKYGYMLQANKNADGTMSITSIPVAKMADEDVGDGAESPSDGDKKPQEVANND